MERMNRLAKRLAISAAVLAAGCWVLSAFIPTTGALWSEQISMAMNVSFANPTPTPEEERVALRISGPTTIAIESLSANGAANDDGSLTASGQLCIANTGTAPTEGLWIFVSVQEAGETQVPASYAAEQLPAPPPAEKIEEGAEQPWRHCYDYTVTFSPVEGVTTYTAAAMVLISNHADYEEPGSYGPSAEAGFTVERLPEAEQTEIAPTESPTDEPTATDVTPEETDTPTEMPGPTEEAVPIDTPTPEAEPPTEPQPDDESIDAPDNSEGDPTAKPTPAPTPTADKGDIDHNTSDSVETPTGAPPTDPPADSEEGEATETPPPVTEEPAG